ncbi:hypothetical protein HAX54_027119 [Datura stramonium]|uniref:Uncharacterized protein n=1 Tax=Datura stramonium TaxID=4076 RepID=A0ABS8V254_DATST|nr:hypothetical protein [Datura stramonium]
MYSMPTYPYLATDYGTQLSVFTHHMWIGGFLIVGAAAHAAIFMVRDYDPIIVTAPGATASTSLTWWGGDLVAVGGKVALLPIPLGTADFLVHHIHAFTIHVTSDVWGSKRSRVVTHITEETLRRVLLLLMGGSMISYGHRIQDPLHVRPIAHAIWDPHFGQPAVEAFTRGGALAQLVTLYNQKWKPSVSLVQKCRISSESSFVRLFGVSSLAWTGHLVHVAITASRGEYVRWNNFLDVLPHPQGLGPLFTGQWNLYAQTPTQVVIYLVPPKGRELPFLLFGGIPSTNAKFMAD